MSEQDLTAMVAAVWVRKRDLVVGRLHDVVAALGVGDVDEAAAGEAHRLAGALGTYGKPGSDLARQAEQALLSGEVPTGLAPALLALVEKGALDGDQQAAGDQQQQGDPQR